jgi:predicted pyridoxine 5'-phosphate oxidase superfamily flavin-nucleotide-binding protein
LVGHLIEQVVETMPQHYHTDQRAFQDRFDTRRLADRLAESTSDVISERFRVFIERRDMFFIATAGPDGWPEASYKGGEPGFVRVLDEHTLAYPVYNGNGMFLTAGNLVANPRVGMLFIDWVTGTRLRLSGHASIDPADPLVAQYPGAQFVVRVRTREVFANCRRYVHRYELVERSPFVPSATGEAPVPDWKLDPWFDGTLPADDPAIDPRHPNAPSIPEF